MSALPTGTVTFVFSDIEGSTRLVQQLGADYPALLADHNRLIGDAYAARSGHVFGSEGDALFAAFDSAAAAIQAAAEAQRALARHAWPAGAEVKVRMGVHTGEVKQVGDNYVGLTLHQVARVMSAGHGGQVLVSAAARQLAADALPPELELRDLGEHRLKDLAQAVRLYQLHGEGLAAEFAALRTLDARPNNLPVQLTSFVGREELAKALATLRATRLLTLSGPGGTGKTRLALQLAAESLDEFADGVWFVALDSVSDAELVVSAIASTVGAAISPSKSVVESLLDHLRGRKVLLVLDNFEQVLDAGPTIGQLLRELPDLKVIVTSRIVLRVYGEHELAVPPLGLPPTLGPGSGPLSAQDVGASEAVRLFVERARAVQPAFELTDQNAASVVEIVTRLDGLPLAIELAAARMRILSVDQIRSRLDQRLALLTGGARDLPTRQQTLRGAIDWSYHILDEPEQRLFERFSIFAGGAFLPEAERVCGEPAELGIDVLDGLSALSDKSLVRAALTSVDDPRFAMLATIREYAAEQLAQGKTDAELAARHAETYAAIVDACAEHLTGPQGTIWRERLELDHDNLRAALDWSVAARRAELAMRIVAGLWRFWQVRGHLHEARRRAEQVLAMDGVDQQPAELRARAYSAAGSIAYWQGDFVTTNRHYAAALTAARETGDDASIAFALYNFSFAALDHEASTQEERFVAGRPAAQEALELYTRLGDEKGIADVHWLLAIGAAAAGELPVALSHAEASLAAHRKLGDPFSIGWSAHMLTLYSMAVGAIDQATAYATEALHTFRSSRDVAGMIVSAYDFAMIGARRGDRETEMRLAGAVTELGRQTGVGVMNAAFEILGWKLPTMPTDEQDLRWWNEGAQMTADEAADYALAHGASADPARATPDAARAEALAG